jgi:multidrug efflux system membrane fusion protein
MDTQASPPAPVTDESTATRRWTYIVAALIVAAVAALVWYRLHAHATEDATGRAGGANRRFGRVGAMPVSVGTATKKTFDIYVNGLGTVTPLETATVRSRVDGELVKVPFKEGDFVKEGDLLAQIDPRPFEVQVMQAQGQLAKDESLLKNAEVDLERYRTLLAEDSTSKQQVDTQQALVGQYKATLQSDQAAVANAKLQLSYAHIVAPISGRLGLRQVDRGNIVHSGDTNGLVVITKLNPISVLFTVPEDQVRALMRTRRSGVVSPVEAWDRANTTKLADGTLTTIDNQVDPTTGTVKLRATFDNDHGVLFPNQFVNVKLLIDRVVDATVVPVAAIRHGQQGSFVYLAKPDGTVAVQNIETGSVQGDQVAVTKGLDPGASVVTDGGDKLRDGAKIEPITAEQRTPAGPDGANGARPQRGQWQKNGGNPNDPNRKHKPDPANASSSP